VCKLGPVVHPVDVSWMKEAADLAVDGASVAVDNEDSLFGRTDEIRSENAGACDGPVGCSPLGQVAI